MTQPLISVVIPAYNRGQSIVRAIDSVRGQTHRNLEIIVVDDGSSDATYAAVRQVMAAEPRLLVIKHERNLGAQAARNTGIRAANGSWLAFLDSDDTYLPDSLERRLAAALREGSNAVHAECLALRADGSMKAFGTPPMRGDIRRDVLTRPGPTFQGMLVRAQCLVVIAYLDERLVAYQEWDTAIRLSRVTRFSFVPEPTFIYNLQGLDTISTDLRRSVKGYEQVVRKHAIEILRTGGPQVLSRHLAEAARQHGRAGDRPAAWLRLFAAGVVWPFAARRLRREGIELLRGQ